MWAPTFYDPFQVKHRRRTSKKQFSILEKAFNENPKPNAATRRDLAEKLKMTVRGVQVWFQNRRAKAKAQRLKMAKKNGSTASSPSAESEKNNNSTNNESSTESSSETAVNAKKESSESLTDKTVSSPSAVKDIKEETKNASLDIDNKLKLEKEYSLLSNSYFQVDDDTNQGIVPFADTTSDYFFDKQDAALGQGFGPLHTHDFYGGASLNMNRRSRAKSLPNVFNLGMYINPQQQLTNSLNQTLPFQGLHQHPQLPTQAQPYSLIGGPKSTSGSYSPQSLQFLRQKSPYSPNPFLYTQKAQSLPSMGPSNDSTASSPSLGSEKGSQTRLAGLSKHSDHLFYNGIDGTGINRGRGYVNYMTSPGLGDNIPSPHSTTSNSAYSPTYQSFIPDVSSINGIRPLDDSFGYMGNPYSIAQQTLNNPYANNIQNFVPDLNAGTGVLQGIPSYPAGFNPGRRSSCPPEFLASVNSLQLSLDENLTKQKGLETIKEDEGIE